MNKHLFYTVGLILLVTTIFLSSSIYSQPGNVAALEPNSNHSVDEAMKHALRQVEVKYNLPGLTGLQWEASADNTPDLSYATHHVFVSKAEILGEIQAAYAINPAHSGFTTHQLTVYVHAPDEKLYSHKVTIFDSEVHVQWVGTVEEDGHVAEYMHYE